MKKGIIFDMDGTIWDSSENVAKSWDIAVKNAGYKEHSITQSDIMNVMGKTMDVIADLLFPYTSPGQERDLLRKACEEYEVEYLSEHGGKLYPEVIETLRKLREEGYHLYIVSNCQSGYIETFLDFFDIDTYGDNALIEDIECYGNNLKSKGENIALVAKRNNLDMAVYVGDIQGDYDSATEAQVGFIHAAYGFGTVNANVPVVRSFSELTKAIPAYFNAVHMRNRMTQGKMYISSMLPPEDEKLKDWLDKFNNAPRSEAEKRTEYLRNCFGALGENCYIEPRFYFDHGYNIFLGNNVYMNTGCIILDQCPVRIGDNTMFGPRVGIYCALHPIDAMIRNLLIEGGAPIEIGKNCWIGGDVTICPGVTIGDNVVIGAGSVVTRDIPSDTIAVGNPCRVLREISDADREYWLKQKIEFEQDTGINPSCCIRETEDDR